MTSSNSSKKDKNTAIFTCIITAIVTFMVALGTMGFQVYQMYTQDAFQRKDIRYQAILKKTEELSNAIVDIRATNQRIRMTYCDGAYEKKLSNKQKLNIQLKRFDVRVSLMKAHINSQFILNQEIYDEIKKYLEWDEHNTNLCIIDDEMWKKREGAINILLNNFIRRNS